MRKQRDVNTDGKRIFIVGSIVIFVAAVGAMVLVIMGMIYILNEDAGTEGT